MVVTATIARFASLASLTFVGFEYLCFIGFGGAVQRRWAILADPVQEPMPHWKLVFR